MKPCGLREPLNGAAAGVLDPVREVEAGVSQKVLEEKQGHLSGVG
jgi:hypothetical protein